jgi:hypothetical protein
VSERARLSLALCVVLGLAVGWYALGRSGGGDSREIGGELAAAEAALEAWGRWAGDGDLAHLDQTFADGPQLAQLHTEDPAIMPGLPYRFDLVDATVPQAGLVRGTVLLTRPGEREQRFHWDIELVQVDGKWRLWTVRTTSDG